MRRSLANSAETLLGNTRISCSPESDAATSAMTELPKIRTSWSFARMARSNVWNRSCRAKWKVVMVYAPEAVLEQLKRGTAGAPHQDSAVPERRQNDLRAKIPRPSRCSHCRRSLSASSAPSSSSMVSVSRQRCRSFRSHKWPHCMGTFWASSCNGMYDCHRVVEDPNEKRC